MCQTVKFHKLNNMTNKDGDFLDASYDTNVARLLAMHLVSQILDEASIIVNAANDSGQPWMYLSTMKTVRNLQKDSHDNELTYVVSKDDNELEKECTLVTSTPQKKEDKVAKPKNDNGAMGQGDEEFEVMGQELRKSTSMIINHLFDMSDVEHLITDEIDVIQNRYSRSEEQLIENVFKQDFELQPSMKESSMSSENSSYSFLNDLVSTNIPECFSFPKNYDEDKKDIIMSNIDFLKTEELSCSTNEIVGKTNNNDLAAYENAYLTMNRDYEQYSEEEEPVLLDPKLVSLHEIELVADKTSKDDLKISDESKNLNAISGISTTGTSSGRGNIVRRCRHHGARLLSCLKGLWWRRKLSGKRKDLCPLSPDARRRAASLLDQRNLCTPSPSTSQGWKFNTVNEALVHSSRWKDFGLKMRLNENEEF